MKKIILLLVLFISLPSFAQSGWQQINIGSNAEILKLFFLNDLTGFASTNREHMYKTSNGGISWQRLSIEYSSSITGLVFLNENTGFYTYQKIFKTTTGGVYWTAITSDSTYSQDIIFVNTNTGFACGKGVYKTTDQGESWVNIIQSKNYFPSIFFINELTGYTSRNAGTSSQILKTTDGGYTWSHLNYLYNNLPNKIYFLNEQTGFIIGEIFNSGGLLIKTTDAGISWHNSILDVPSNRYNSISFVNANTGYVISYSRIYKTTNGGENFFSFYSPSYPRLNDIRFTSENTGYVGGYIGNGTVGNLIKTSNGGITFTNNVSSKEVPDKFSLSQNYPNPFNPNTVISFQVPVAGFISLKVFDINGREISELVNENLNAGEYKINFDGAEFPSGVYYYKLTGDNFSEVKKMVLVK